MVIELLYQIKISYKNEAAPGESATSLGTRDVGSQEPAEGVENLGILSDALLMVLDWLSLLVGMTGVGQMTSQGAPCQLDCSLDETSLLFLFHIPSFGTFRLFHRNTILKVFCQEK
ncbi:hypothetical protein A2356_03050 [Candidatus Nomurabacteria bacterium RIFOXYB1_FULL_39_16]|uniref:Uncharacterized protein n=1 Tax=Candidatus Nomurabacteria bacterium RIFOXYB1_FULL_39_16 TaxID=1801803 RepID=A0A1F6YSZ7_9BACT|nr:MAG: hypothetical protein A2356_03050 [Candidatus Nomurabacteria bacterium RIFOXYB1_FULL_39_16]OGJ14978.1 MAG: hypothetical protein A2585_03760 [Candidatus Nomurabacteria bacterium RIFOXYD1_FULL_39_12]